MNVYNLALTISTPSSPFRIAFNYVMSNLVFLCVGRRRRLKGIHYRSDTNRTGAEGLSFYYPRLLHCLDQMLAVMLLSQHRVSSSKTVRPRAPCGARCIGHAVSTWSAVCSEAPHSQFDEGARPHLCMDEWNRPTPCWWLNSVLVALVRDCWCLSVFFDGLPQLFSYVCTIDLVKVSLYCL